MTNRWRWRCTFFVFVSISIIAPSVRAFEGRNSVFDCGTLSLYVLLREMEINRTLNDVAAALPEPSAAGLSMKDLQDGGRKLGVNLVGVKVQATNQPATVTGIALMRDGDHGHYVVIRPVGTSGKLVQILDSIQAPIIIDASDLYGSRNWTGMVLVQDVPLHAIIWSSIMDVLIPSIVIAILITMLRIWRLHRLNGSIFVSRPRAAGRVTPCSDRG